MEDECICACVYLGVIFDMSAGRECDLHRHMGSSYKRGARGGRGTRPKTQLYLSWEGKLAKS